ncbi:MAG: hypothetical protein KBG43_04485 [Paludibacteraceae bacterium]|nr:hypothetical protein [Paludibacteraceae bacterium]
MLNDVGKYRLMDAEKYMIFDHPVPYKNFLIKPVKMIDYVRFHESVVCLLLDKNSVPDIEVISMTYLEYLLHVGKENPLYFLALDQLLRTTLMVKTVDDEGNQSISELTESEDVQFLTNCKGLVVKGNTIDGADFDEIKAIICEQNQIEMIDETISKEVRDEMAKAEEYKRRQNQNKICSLEDQLVAVVIKTGLSFEYLHEITIRKFSKILERADHAMHYEIYLEGVVTGQMKMKDGEMPKHWLADLHEEDKHKNAKMDLDALQKKVANERPE